MGFLWRLLVLLLVLTLGGVTALAWFGLSEHPRVIQDTELSAQERDRAERLVAQLLPTQASGDHLYQLYLSQPDLNLVSRYLLRRHPARAVFVIETRHAWVDATVHIPGLPLRPYLNASLEIREAGAGPYLAGLRIGRIDVPAAIAPRLLQAASHRVRLRDDASLAAISVVDARLRPGLLSLRYLWLGPVGNRP
jgi:hypothetical protein